MPEVGELELVERARPACGPGTPDNGAVVGPRRLEGLVWATGHWRNGVLLAPLTGESVAALLAAGVGPPDELAALSPGRFERAGCAAMKKVFVNGEYRELPDGATVRDGGGASWARRSARDGRGSSTARWSRAASGRTQSCATARRSRCCTRCRAGPRRPSRSPAACCIRG